MRCAAGRDQRLVLVLAVDLDQLAGDLDQCAHRGHPAVDPGPGAAFRRHGAGQDDLALVIAVGHHETGFDDGFGGAGPHDGGAGLAPQDEVQRLHHQRLPGPGLPRQGGHPGTERQGQVLDDAQIPDAQLGEHQRSALCPTGRGPPAGGRATCHRSREHRCARPAPVAWPPGRSPSTPARDGRSPPRRSPARRPGPRRSPP